MEETKTNISIESISVERNIVKGAVVQSANEGTQKFLYEENTNNTDETGSGTNHGADNM